ncbi:MAG: hypothetical protein JO303_10845 [Caulobacteraceae bacterium]|nr:hypothetical protein [Caulobacteraceae bacterium]MBV9813418.1 hypothetical protein [Acetobacteraceae bacterium]
MSEFWSPGSSIAVSDSLMPAMEDCGALPDKIYCEILNLKEVSAAGFCGGRRRTEPFPVVQLKLTLETFDADFFQWCSCNFVSERLRDAMALDSSTARFFEVDASSSEPLPRSKNYQVMEVAAVEDVLDPDKSDYEMRRLMPDMPLSPGFVRHHAVLPGAAPEHGLFYDRFFKTLLCTDAFAVRVLKSGCIGMRFGDPDNPRWGHPLYRTLRGIEEYIDWDPINRVEIMEIVQPIN